MCADNAYELDNLKEIFYLFKENTGGIFKRKENRSLYKENIFIMKINYSELK